jgi:hypothetical protein
MGVIRGTTFIGKSAARSNVFIADLRWVSPSAPGQVRHFLTGETLQPAGFTLFAEDKMLTRPFQSGLYSRTISNFHFIF